MKIHLEQIKANDKVQENSSGFVDSGFVKTCDELVKGEEERINSSDDKYDCFEKCKREAVVHDLRHLIFFHEICRLL